MNARNRSGIYKAGRADGVTFLDVIFGVSLILVVFFAIFGAFRLALIVINTSKAEAGAVALANEQMEFIRSLPYEDVGTLGGIPAGNIEQNATITLNHINYNRRTFIKYVDAPEDGEGIDDENGITTDYKQAKVEMTWTSRDTDRSYTIVSNVVPKGIESTAGGGTLTINVFDAVALPVVNAEVHVENATTSPPISVTTFTNTNGVATFPGTPASSGYEITVTKSGYSTAQTYDTDAQNPNPSPGHLSVAEGLTTSSSFAIDRVATKVVRTFEPASEEEFLDLFNDMSLVASSSNTEVSDGVLHLTETGSSTYASNGLVYSNTVAPSYLDSWNEARFVAANATGTDIVLHIYFDQGGGSYALVSDAYIPGNSNGFSATSSPIDLSNVSISAYPNLVLHAALETSDSAYSPTLDEWRIVYNAGPTPLPNILFAMRGAKTIGTTAGGNPIYKFDETFQTDSNGEITIGDLEWDTYNITVDGATGYAIAQACLPQPLYLPPASATTTDLLLVPATTNSLLVAVVDSTTQSPLPDASVRLYRTVYDETIPSSSCGQSFFSGLSAGTVSGGNPYSIDVTRAGYQPETVTDVEVSGASRITVPLIGD